MDIYAVTLTGPTEQSVFAVIVLTGVLLGIGGAWSRRRVEAVLRMARGER